MPASDAPDFWWCWDQYIDLALEMPDRFAVFAVEAGGELQGLRMLDLKADDCTEFGPLATRLSTAPWNRYPERRYEGVGSVLVAAAILRSLHAGSFGRVQCEASPQAEAFHQENGMIRFDDLGTEGFPRYRFSEEAALDYLMRVRRDGLLDA